MGESSRAHINLHGKHAEQTRSGTAGTNQRKHTINGKEPKSLPKRGKQPHGEAKPRLSSLPERSTTTVLLPLLPLPLQAPGRAQQHKETPTTKHKASATISTDRSKAMQMVLKIYRVTCNPSLLSGQQCGLWSRSEIPGTGRTRREPRVDLPDYRKASMART